MNRVAMANRHCRAQIYFFRRRRHGGEQQQTFEVLVVAALPRVWFEDQMISHPDGIETVRFSPARALEAFFNGYVRTEMGQ